MKAEVLSWFSNIRFYVLVLSFIIAGAQYFIAGFISDSRAQLTFTLLSWYAFTAVIFLYLALLAGPFTKMARWFPWRGNYLKARRAIGVSAFFFSALHVRYALFDYLGGPFTVLSLPPLSVVGIILGQNALLILFLLAITSFDMAVDKMSFRWWKFLHKFVYLAGFAIFFHAIIMGSTLADRWSPVSMIWYISASFLLGIHMYGFYKKRQLLLAKKNRKRQI